MALDITVYWKQNGTPTKDEIQLCLEDYVRGLATVLWDEATQRFYVTLQGNFNSALLRVGPATPAQREMWKEFSDRHRWFEVCVTAGSLNVITREMDHITRAVADGFVYLCNRAWGAFVKYPAPK